MLSGTVAQLDRVRQRCAEIHDEQTRDREAKKRGGAVFAPVFEDVEVEVGFHHPALADTVDMVVGWAKQCGISEQLAADLTRAILVDPVDWVEIVDEAISHDAQWMLDLGPGDLLTRLTQGSLRGTGVGMVAASTRTGQRALFTPGAAPEVAPAWNAFAPKPIRLPNGRVVVETAFTRLTGRSPILLAGMTPTTVDAKIVAAAANAGHWAELAGGGQVTEQIFADRVAELKTLLQPGREVQFNSLFLDPYLWKLQLGGKRLVQKARAAGAPFDGVVVTAGIPELDEAVALIEELTEVGIAHVAFKPGTVAQIRAVLRIADAVPDYPVIMHIEGGRAGGHHSWEDLDDLLLDTYAELRNRANVVVCVGGGIGTPERATEYLTGEWSAAHGYPAMPLDGVLVGTAAMATLEATTAPEVKQLLVDTPGHPEWVGAGTAVGGMASGRSQLGADIHEIDNAASRTGRLLDEVAGDADAVAERREEIIAALNVTAKPYFGDVATMTYLEWLERYVELAVGLDRRTDFDCGADFSEAIADATRSVWLDITWRDRFAEMVRRTESRLNPADRGEIETLFADDDAFEAPVQAICTLKERYPAAAQAVLHPADVPFFVNLCKIPGKPVNFVPVVDGDVRRWWRSDSLWQAHDPRYGADQVCIIPGTVAVAGITRVNEPVGELLDRFEQNTAHTLMRAGVTPLAVDGRRRAGVTAGVIDLVLAAPDVQWAGRTTLNPVHRLGDLAEWAVDEKGAHHAPTGATLVSTEGPDSDNEYVELTVPLLGANAVRIRITVPASAYNGGAPVVSQDDAEAAMSALLAVAAGKSLPEVKSGVAHVNVAWSPDLIADHAGVTGSGLPAALSTIGRTVPDVLVGACWPAVFAVLGATRTEAGSVIEGMLDLVHLDHRIELTGELPAEHAVLAVRAESGEVLDTDMGRVVEVRVTVGLMLDQGLETPPVAKLVERFAIRGRNGAGELSDPPRAAGTVSGRGHRHPAPPPSRRGRHRAPRDGRVRRGVRRSQPDPHLRQRRPAGRSGQPDRARHVALGRRPARGVRGGSRISAAPTDSHRLDHPVPGHGPPGRGDRRARRARRGGRRQRDRRGVLPDRGRSGDDRHGPAGRAEDRVRLPGTGHSDQGDGPGRPLAVQGRQGGLGARGQAHPRGAGLLDPGRGPGQPDLPQGPRRGIPPPAGRAAPDPVHPGRDGGPRAWPRSPSCARRARSSRARCWPDIRSASTTRSRPWPGCCRSRRCSRWCSSAVRPCTSWCPRDAKGRATIGWPPSGPRRSGCPTPRSSTGSRDRRARR